MSKFLDIIDLQIRNYGNEGNVINLYVALSRCKNPNNIFIENLLENSSIIDNIVWKETFDI